MYKSKPPSLVKAAKPLVGAQPRQFIWRRTAAAHFHSTGCNQLGEGEHTRPTDGEGGGTDLGVYLERDLEECIRSRVYDAWTMDQIDN